MTQTRRLHTLLIPLAALTLLTGCHSPQGAFMPYTGGTQTLHSTETSPKTFRLIDLSTGETAFEIDIPAGHQLTYDFIEKGGDDPVSRPSLMRYEIFAIGTRTGRLRNSISVPAATARRADWYIRDGMEARPEPPEYRFRTDRVEDRPDWWSPRGGAMPNEGIKTTLYDN
ncbi:MAG: hypothetical protein HRU76_04485 [Phycisphaeraceae bacterium]|nr:hypothetical protein [Phycisphaerales bacterium]QOJ16890.1 MAG: hypothetical protein HRU76_04485 [Phycisphaeraceae bacterium]